MVDFLPSLTRSDISKCSRESSSTSSSFLYSWSPSSTSSSTLTRLPLLLDTEEAGKRGGWEDSGGMRGEGSDNRGGEFKWRMRG